MSDINRETWNLDYHIAKYSLPRLQRFKELSKAYPPDLTEEQWDIMLDDMIYAMDSLVSLDVSDTEVDEERVSKGLRVFGERLRDLWW